jgi:UDP:flavonoid glycosyltransferase YjiC (YdhE family)
MRVLMTTTRGAGHLGPLLPFARALLRNNDEVVVAIVRSAAHLVEDAGLDVWPLPETPAEQRDRIFARVRTLTEDEANRFVVSELFARIDARQALPGVSAAIESLRPDVVVSESCEFAGPLAAEAAGVPAVRVAVMLAGFEDFLTETAGPALDELRSELGLPADPDGERLRAAPRFSLMPSALDDQAPPHVQRFRDVRSGGPRPLPDHWNGNEWPLVYLTFGSSVPQNGLFPGLYRAAIDALAVLPARVLVTIGRDRDPRDLGPVAPNVHVARWIPQDDVLPHAAAMVCHGGSGTVRGALAAGVPMAVLPQFADMSYNARRVAELGAGIAVNAVEQLTGAAHRLLGETSYREAARGIAADIAVLPTVDAAVGALQAYSQPRSVAWSTA